MASGVSVSLEGVAIQLGDSVIARHVNFAVAAGEFGFLFDRVLRFVASRTLKRYGVSL